MAVYDYWIGTEKGDNIAMVVMSDHGTYDYPYEVELTNHGFQDEGEMRNCVNK